MNNSGAKGAWFFLGAIAVFLYLAITDSVVLERLKQGFDWSAVAAIATVAAVVTSLALARVTVTQKLLEDKKNKEESKKIVLLLFKDPILDLFTFCLLVEDLAKSLDVIPELQRHQEKLKKSHDTEADRDAVIDQANKYNQAILSTTIKTVFTSRDLESINFNLLIMQIKELKSLSLYEQDEILFYINTLDSIKGLWKNAISTVSTPGLALTTNIKLYFFYKEAVNSVAMMKSFIELNFPTIKPLD